MNRAHYLVAAAYDGSCAYSLGYTEVSQLCHTGTCNQNIVRFDIPMYNLIFVSQTQSRCNLANYTYGFLIIKSSLFLYHVTENFSVNEFHDNEMNISFLAYIIYSYNVRMRKPRCCL